MDIKSENQAVEKERLKLVAKMGIKEGLKDGIALTLLGVLIALALL